MGGCSANYSNNSKASVSNKKVGYYSAPMQATLAAIRKKIVNRAYGKIYPHPVFGQYFPKFHSAEVTEYNDSDTEKTRLDVYISDEQFETFLTTLKNRDTVRCGFDFYSCCFTEEQVKKSLEILFDNEDPSLNDVTFILNFLKRTLNPEKMEHAKEILKDTLQRIDLHPASEQDAEFLAGRGFTESQREYFEYLNSPDFDKIFGEEFIKDVVFNTLLPKAEELCKEECLGAKYFLFFEASYSRFIDKEMFAKYKDNLSGYFILHHPELYDTLELREDVKKLLENRIKIDITNKLGIYGYPAGLIQCSVDLDLEGIHLYDSVNDNFDISKATLHIIDYQVDDPSFEDKDTMPRDFVTSII